MAFFPCIHFCDAKTLYFKGVSIPQKKWSLSRIMENNIHMAQERESFFIKLMQLFKVCDDRKLRLIVENPYNPSGMTYLQNNFPDPTIIDKNRMMRGDYFVKPTGYWFVGCSPTDGFTYQMDKEQKVIMNMKRSKGSGICSEERSMISPDYARNFICDFILGRKQPEIDPQLF